MKTVNPMKPSARMRIPRQHPAERVAAERAKSFQEVSLGFTEEEAVLEATRCLECTDPVCTEGCPVNIDIRTFIQKIYEKDYAGAVETIRATNSLPAICGRVCPQEEQCEKVCTLGRKHKPVAIGKLERFVADFAMRHNGSAASVERMRQPQSVAIVGGGPAGLTCAAELAKLGYGVTLFEALHAVGGVLRYGIPEFRLPRTILDEEIRRVEKLGVKIVTNFLVGRTATIDELFDEWKFNAVFLGTGAGTPHFLGVPGENLSGVYSANEFLTRINLMHANQFPRFDTPIKLGKRVAVIGGGNTAMDAVRTAKRLGAEKAYLLYRRTKAEMPAREEEVLHAEEERIEMMFLVNPTKILGTFDHWVRGIELQRMELAEPDASGRRKPVPIAGSEFTLELDTVIEAIGQSPNPIIQSTTHGLETSKKGTILARIGQQTSRRGVFVGGDVARGGATVILAMRDGRMAAKEINEFLHESRNSQNFPESLGAKTSTVAIA
jgi:glutamate synthase (NADPH/NADH) small chain